MSPVSPRTLTRIVAWTHVSSTGSDGRWGRRMMMATVVLVAVALGHVWLHFQVLEAGYALAHETRIAHLLVDRNEKLRLELAMRRNPGVVEQRARDELGMSPPDPSAIRVLRAPAPGAERPAIPEARP